MSKYIPGGLLFTPKRLKMVGYTADTLSFSTPFVAPCARNKNNFFHTDTYGQIGHTLYIFIYNTYHYSRWYLYCIIYLFTRGGNLGPRTKTSSKETPLLLLPQQQYAVVVVNCPTKFIQTHFSVFIYFFYCHIGIHIYFHVPSLD